MRVYYFASSLTLNKVLNLTSTAALVLRFNATLLQNKRLRSGKLARRYALRSNGWAVDKFQSVGDEVGASQ